MGLDGPRKVTACDGIAPAPTAKGASGSRARHGLSIGPARLLFTTVTRPRGFEGFGTV
jgi:hypothetical protein